MTGRIVRVVMNVPKDVADPDEVLGALRAAMIAHPGQRAGEIIRQACGNRTVYWLSDSALIELLRAYAGSADGTSGR